MLRSRRQVSALLCSARVPTHLTMAITLADEEQQEDEKKEEEEEEDQAEGGNGEE